MTQTKSDGTCGRARVRQRGSVRIARRRGVCRSPSLVVGSGAPPVRRPLRQLTAASRPAQPAAPADAPVGHDARIAVAVAVPSRLRAPLLPAAVLAGGRRLRSVAAGRLRRGRRDDDLLVPGLDPLLLLWVRRVGRQRRRYGPTTSPARVCLDNRHFPR